jgi:hypothetical protein
MEAEPRSLAELRRLANACRRRADLRPVRVLPGELDGALADVRLVIGGADAAIGHGAAVGQAREHIAYVRSSDVAGFLSVHFGSPENDSPNLSLRVVDDEAWPSSISALCRTSWQPSISSTSVTCGPRRR